MEQQNKYYTPDAKDFCIGYCNYEIFSEGEWSKQPPLENSYDFNEVYDLFNEGKAVTNLRTKSLDQSDIESCGWKWFTNSSSGEEYEISSNGKTYSLIQVDYSHDIYVFVEDGYGDKTLFHGECKSINELRTIIKFLKITEDDKS